MSKQESGQTLNCVSVGNYNKSALVHFHEIYHTESAERSPVDRIARRVARDIMLFSKDLFSCCHRAILFKEYC